MADTVGSGQWVPLADKGPREVRYLARAINAMQERINRLIADRTEALAAVSHDLRTPLARLRLRAGFLEDTNAQKEIEADVTEMEAMITGVLAYLSGEKDPEPARSVNVASILATRVDDDADQGRDVTYDGPDQAQAIVRPLALKRVVGNLIDNAVNYGGNAHVSLTLMEDALCIRVEDNGPGLPEAELDRVTTPFYRVEAHARAMRAGWGWGWPLSAVRWRVAAAGSGCSTGWGGLCAEIVLPRMP